MLLMSSSWVCVMLYGKMKPKSFLTKFHQVCLSLSTAFRSFIGCCVLLRYFLLDAPPPTWIKTQSQIPKFYYPSLNSAISFRMKSNKSLSWLRQCHINTHKCKSSMPRWVPHWVSLLIFATRQVDSIPWVCAPVSGSIKLYLWQTVSCLKPRSVNSDKLSTHRNKIYCLVICNSWL